MSFSSVLVVLVLALLLLMCAFLLLYMSLMLLMVICCVVVCVVYVAHGVVARGVAVAIDGVGVFSDICDDGGVVSLWGLVLLRVVLA